MHAQETNKTEGDTYTIMYNEAVDKHNDSVPKLPSNLDDQADTRVDQLMGGTSS